MQTKVSTKGQVVLPSRIRNKLGLRAGDPLDATIEGGRIVLTPRRARRKKTRIITDPDT
ncbi:MAG: AbrB/MazE/SpoVT family DNA-binding domain-containing protein, partial [Candidatus Acidiferrum sp.]